MTRRGAGPSLGEDGDIRRAGQGHETAVPLGEGAPIGGLLYSVIKAAHLIERHVNRSLHPEELTIRQVGALAHVARHPASSRADLARAVLTTPQAAGSLVRRLVAGGYISVVVGGVGLPSAFNLTADGQSALEWALSVVAVSEDEILTILAFPATLELDRLLHQVIDGLA